MKRIRKFLFRFFALAMLAMLVAGSVLGGFGYKMYRDALAEQPLDEKVAEIQADPNYTTLAEIPEIYLDAVVAVEDHRFEQHFGIDLIAIGRAAWNNLTSWSLREGGSTITQQLAKNLYFTQEKSFIRKRKRLYERQDFRVVCQFHLFRRRLLLYLRCKSRIFWESPL